MEQLLSQLYVASPGAGGLIALPTLQSTALAGGAGAELVREAALQVETEGEQVVWGRQGAVVVKESDPEPCPDKLPVKLLLVLHFLQCRVHDGDQEVHEDHSRDYLVGCHEEERKESLKKSYRKKNGYHKYIPDLISDLGGRFP